VATARHAATGLAAARLAPSITWPDQCGVELAANQLFDELPRPIANLRLDRIEPIVEKLGSRVCFTLRGISLRDTAGHGVVSGPARQRRMIRG
jgi:hypothetical protein